MKMEKLKIAVVAILIIMIISATTVIVKNLISASINRDTAAKRNTDQNSKSVTDYYKELQ